jgi:hypothetical protein
MEFVKIKTTMDILRMLVDSDILTTKDFEVLYVEEIADVFKDNEVWKAQKLKSDKEYKKLKEIEFKLIHKIE